MGDEIDVPTQLARALRRAEDAEHELYWSRRAVEKLTRQLEAAEARVRELEAKRARSSVIESTVTDVRDGLIVTTLKLTKEARARLELSPEVAEAWRRAAEREKGAG